METIKISPLIAREIPAVIEIADEAHQDGFMDEKMTAGGLQKMLADKKCYYVIAARQNKELLGFATTSYSWGKLHIQEVVVKKEKRGLEKKLFRIN